MLKKKNVFGFLFFVMMIGNAQDTIMPLWPSEIPNVIKNTQKEIKEYTNILRISKVQEPTIEVYLPSKRNANGQAMLIFPGGGYKILAYDWEGTDMAKFLNSKGIAGIVVKYRLPDSNSSSMPHFAPLQDAQRAIKMVRANAKAWNINAEKVGIMGFSAGGHLAATLGTHFNEKVYENQDAIDTLSVRPNYMALIYPVITMQDSTTHKGSKNALLGEKPTKEMVHHFSTELQVTDKTPPTFLVHATDDAAVPVENSLLFYKALKAKKVSATLFIYPEGGHGFSFGYENEFLKDWTHQLSRWLASQ
ncbi:MAG: alpha/beta hydrolase [Cellulophaga sp.]|nr:alpha/beta hydrolase [Cellulophaga sp.]